jgi:protein-arginine kinase activator protein McsA
MRAGKNMTTKKTCKKHGEVSVWIVCRHVGEGSAETIIFSEQEDALCFECARNFHNLTESDVVGMCVECLKDFTAKMMIQTKTFANLQARIKGIEHLKGQWRSPGTGKEAL